MSNRKPIVKCPNEISHMCDIDIGVPQGSVLGHILFILYVNDINQHVHIGVVVIYMQTIHLTISPPIMLIRYENVPIIV